MSKSSLSSLLYLYLLLPTELQIQKLHIQILTSSLGITLKLQTNQHSDINTTLKGPAKMLRASSTSYSSMSLHTMRWNGVGGNFVIRKSLSVIQRSTLTVHPYSIHLLFLFLLPFVSRLFLFSAFEPQAGFRRHGACSGEGPQDHLARGNRGSGIFVLVLLHNV